MKKRYTKAAILLTALVTFMSVFAVGAAADNVCSMTDVQKKITATGVYSNWDGVTNVALFKNAAGEFCFAVDGDSVDIYTSKNGTTAGKTVSLAKQHPIFGTALCDADGNYYLVTGEDNPTDDTSTETVFISKYDSTGTHIKTVGDNGSSSLAYYYDESFYTKYPFEAGNCDAAIYGGVLAVNYGRKMYSGHQSNSVFAVNTADMTKTSPGIFYESHSFAQRVVPTSDGFVFASEGDAYDRAFSIYSLTLSDGKYSSSKEAIIFDFYIEEGASTNMYIVNNNFAHMGGLAALSDGRTAFAAMSARSLNENAKNEPEDIFIQIFDPKKDLSTAEAYTTVGTRSGTAGLKGDKNATNYGVKWLSSFKDGENAKNVQIAGIAGNKLVILYELYSNYTYKGVYYTILDGSGSVLTDSTLFSETALLDPCEMPVYAGGKVFWAGNKYGDNSGTIYIYALDPGEPDEPAPESKPVSDCVVEPIADAEYTGDAITPEITVKDGEYTLVKGKDYTVSYSDNTEPGKATVTITGIGSYTGTKNVTFNITEKIKRVPYFKRSDLKFFTSVNGEEIPIDAEGYSATVIVYGRPTCGNTRSTIYAINNSAFGSSPEYRFIFADADNNSVETIKEFAEEMGGSFIYCCGDNNIIKRDMWSYLSQAGTGSTITLPTVVILDSLNNVRSITTGMKTADEIYGKITDIFNDPLTYSETVPEGAVVNQIRFSKLPKTEYWVGEELDTKNGLLFVLFYKESGEPGYTYAELTSDMVISAFNNSQPGLRTLTVQYGGKTTSYEVTFAEKKLTGIKLTPPARTNYIIGEALDLSGAKLNALYENGTTREIPLTGDMLTGYDSSKAGKCTVTVIYETMTASFEVTIEEKPAAKLTGITVSAPTKTVYTVGEPLDLSGARLTAHYEDGSSREITLTAAMTSGFDSLNAGKCTVIVAYEEMTASFEVTIEEIEEKCAVLLDGVPAESLSKALKSLKSGDHTIILNASVTEKSVKIPKKLGTVTLKAKNGAALTTGSITAYSPLVLSEVTVKSSKIGKYVTVKAYSDLTVTSYTGLALGTVTVKGRASLNGVSINGDLKLLAAADKTYAATDTLKGVSVTKKITSYNSIIFENCANIGTVSAKGNVTVKGGSTKGVSVTAKAKSGTTSLENLTLTKKISVKNLLNVDGTITAGGTVTATGIGSAKGASLTATGLYVKKSGLTAGTKAIDLKITDKNGNAKGLAQGDVVAKKFKGSFDPALLTFGGMTLTQINNKLYLI